MQKGERQKRPTLGACSGCPVIRTVMGEVFLWSVACCGGGPILKNII